MFKIKVLKKLKYKNCPIYIRQLDNSMFEFLLINQWELYSEYFVFYPKWYRRFLKDKYTEKELQDIILFIYGGAKYTIDKLRGVDR